MTFLLFSRTRLGVRPSNFDAKWLNRRGFTYKFAFCNKKSKLFVTPDPQTPKPPKFGKFRSALRSKAMILIYVCVVRLQCAKKKRFGWLRDITNRLGFGKAAKNLAAVQRRMGLIDNISKHATVVTHSGRLLKQQWSGVNTLSSMSLK